MRGKYTLVDTEDKLVELHLSLINENGTSRHDLLAIDTETNGLGFWKDVVIGFSISADSNSGWYIPLLTWEADKASLIKGKKVNKKPYDIYLEGNFRCIWTGTTYHENVTQQEYQPPELIKNLFKEWVTSGAQLLLHNAPFDALFIEKNFGFDIAPYIFADTLLMKHVLDENTSKGLKETAILWSEELGVPAEQMANQEQLELGTSVIKNGGKYSKGEKHLWRASLEHMYKYAIADTFLTFGLFEVAMKKFEMEFEEKHYKWFFEEEVMPLCREVVIPMRRQGAAIDIEHFKSLELETKTYLDKLEDSFIKVLGNKLDGFSIGKSQDEEISAVALNKEIIKLEGLQIPLKYTKKTDTYKPSLAKDIIKKEYDKNPHWVWAYILGQDEIKYSDEKLEEIRSKLYTQKTGKRYHFNINSAPHLTWLFCDKLGIPRDSLPQTDSAKPEKGHYIPSMKAEVLKDYMLKQHPEIVTPLLRYKKIFKLWNTYMVPAVTKSYNGVLYMDMDQAGTISGRFACRGGFNLQTLPAVEEVDRCPSCKSKNIDVEYDIAILARIKCKDCNHIEEDIVCPSVIKKGFIAPKGMKILNSDYSSLEPRCLDPQALVQISGNFKKLNEIEVGDFIWTKDGNRKVLNKWYSTKKTKILRTRKGVLESSEEHRHFVKGKGFIPAKDIKIGDVIERVGMQTILEKTSIELPIYPKKVKEASKPLEKFIVDEDIAWMLGAFIGDGVWAGSRRSNYVGICGIIQDGVLNKFIDILSAYGFVLSAWKHRRTKDMMTAVFNNAWLVDIFKNTFKVIGEEEKSLRIPPYLFCASKTLKLAFLAGLLDTDGTFNKKKSELSISTKSRYLATDLILFLESLDIEASLTIGDKKTTKRVHELYQIRITSKWINMLHDMQLQDYQIVERKKVGGGHKVVREHPYEIEVLDIKDGEEKKLVDITVEGNEEFVCNGMRTHNCFAYVSGDKKLKEVYWNDLDLYSKVYCDMFDFEKKYSPNPKDENFLKKLAKDKRDLVKVFVLGIPYGARSPQVANLMNLKSKYINKQGKEVEGLDVQGGDRIRAKYLDTYPSLKTYMQNQDTQAITRGYVETLFGRRRHFDFTIPVFQILKQEASEKGMGYFEIIDWFLDLRNKDCNTYELSPIMNRKCLEDLLKSLNINLFDVKKNVNRKWDFVRAMFKNEINNAKNFPIQGLGAHIVNRAMLDMTREFKKHGLQTQIFITVHDEISCYVLESEIDKSSQILQNAMEKNIYTDILDVPMIAEPIIANTLKEAK